MAGASNGTKKLPLSTRYLTRARSAAYQWFVEHFQRYQDDRIAAEDHEDNDLHYIDDRHLAGYHYPPLTSASSHIRILVLEPGQQDAQICCRLEEADLNAHPTYIALSYCWGDASQNRGIICEGYRAFVTLNLYHALLRLRKPENEVRLWIDALCIDQRNLEERQQQIQLMRRIFQEAVTCIAWLGPHAKHDSLAFKLLGTLYEYSASQPLQDNADVLVPGNTLVGRYATTPGQWKALSHFFERSWFERVWTLQEIVLPHHAVMLCGKLMFDADSFYQVVELVHRLGLGSKMLRLQGGYLQSLKVAALRKRFSARVTDMDLLDTLRNTQDRNASNPRDKVIGMLGLCHVSPDLTSQINYQLSVRQLYLIVARHILQSADPFRLFYACSPISDSQDSRLNLPSWAPNWNIRKALAPCIQEFEQNKTYQAGGPGVPSIQFLPTDQGTERLRVRGKIVSTISDSVDKHSDAFTSQYKLIHGPSRFCCTGSRHCYYLGLTLPWVYQTLVDDDDPSSSPPTLEQYYLRTCWTLTPSTTRQDAFWDTMVCTLTNARRSDAMNFQRDLVPFATAEHAYHSYNSAAQVPFLQNLETWISVRKFCTTTRDRIGWVPREARNGDVVCVFQGSKLPYVLRETASDGVYTIVGHCFVSGIMKGEVVDDERLGWRDVVLE